MRNILIIIMVVNPLLFGQWEYVQLLPFEGTFSAFHMLDTANIKAVFYRDSSAVVRSTDGERSWAIVHRIPISQARLTSFVNEQNIFVSSESASDFMKSSDGGESWSPVTLPQRFTEVIQIQFVDSTHGFVLAKAVDNSKNIVLKTTDAGSNWSLIDTSIWIERIDFKDRQTGWVFAGSVRKTTDGGATFSIQNIPFNFSNPSSIEIINDSLLIIGGGRLMQPSPWEFYYVPMLAMSSNQGLTWFRILNFDENQFRGRVTKILFMDGNRAVARLDHRGILYTTNQGASWYPHIAPVQYHSYTDLKKFEDRLYGCASGAVFVASQQDITSIWDLRFNQTMTSCNTAAFIDPTYAIVGTAASVYQPQKVFITTDKGESWEAKAAPWGPSISIEAFNDSILFFATSNAIYKGDLKCENVTQVSDFPGASLRAFHVAPNGNLWVSMSKSLRRSTDGGSTWATFLYALCCNKKKEK